MTTYNDTSYTTTSPTDVKSGRGIMCDNEDHYCDCEHYYCDGSVNMRDISRTATSYNKESYE